MALPETSEPGAESQAVASQEDAVLTEYEMRRLEKKNLRRALRQTGWKVYGAGGAAELLGVKPTTLVSRMKKLGLERHHSDAEPA